MIPTWSFSKLGDFDACKLRCKLKHLDRIPEPERPLPPGKTEHANDRGSRIHDAAERFVGGTGPLTAELAKFEHKDGDYPGHFSKLKRLHALGQVELEGEWGMSPDWEITPWKDAWLRLKLDVIVHESKYEATVIDHKSGRKHGNEVKHSDQLNLYALVAFMRYPELEEVTAELWYLDVGEITTRMMTRSQALQFKRSFTSRGMALTTCIKWPANPNRFSCQWCLYGPEHSGHCAVGVRKA